MLSSDTTNADRAQWALSAIRDFVQQNGVKDPADAIADLMTNLLHLARTAGLEPDVIATRAMKMMREELREDNDGDLSEVARQFQEILTN